jgi:hypothetical protein
VTRRRLIKKLTRSYWQAEAARDQFVADLLVIDNSLTEEGLREMSFCQLAELYERIIERVGAEVDRSLNDSAAYHGGRIGAMACA